MALSQQEFDRLKNNLSLRTKPLNISASTDLGYSSNVGNKLKSAFGDITSGVSVGQNISRGGTTQLQQGLSNIGQGNFLSGIKDSAVGFAKEKVGDLKSKLAIGGGVARGLIAPIEEAPIIKQTLEGIGRVVSPVIESGLETDTGQRLLALQKQYPDAFKSIQDVIDITSLIPIGGGVKVGANVLEKGTVGTVKAVKNIPTGLGGVKDFMADTITPIKLAEESQLNPTRLIPKEQLKNIPIENITAVAENKSVKFDNYLKQAEKAVTDYSQKTPLTIAGDKAGEALTIMNNKLAKQGQLKTESLNIVGERPVGNIAQFRTLLRDELRERVGVNVVISEKGLGIANASGRKSKIAFDQADNKLILDAYSVLNDLGNKPNVRMVDDTIDALQDLLYKRKSGLAIPINGQVEGVLKNITGKLNSAVKKIGGEQYKKANDKFAYIIDVRDKLNKSLGLEGERGGSLMKSLFSPAGEKPRRLFGDTKKLTGIDLVEEATFAKFVMENVGDARQASLLEEAIRGRNISTTGLIEKAFEFGINKLQDPIGKAKRVINDIPKK